MPPAPHPAPDALCGPCATRSGLLDREETKQLMTMLFPEQTDAEFDAAFIKMDDDGSGEVDFDEVSCAQRTCCPRLA